MNRVKPHVPFIQSILKEGNRFKRMDKIRHANKDQVNALSEITLNLLKKKHSRVHQNHWSIETPQKPFKVHRQERGLT